MYFMDNLGLNNFIFVILFGLSFEELVGATRMWLGGVMPINSEINIEINKLFPFSPEAACVFTHWTFKSKQVNFILRYAIHIRNTGKNHI